MKIAGSIFPTLILLISSMFAPIATINNPPIADISFTTEAIKNGFIREAVKVIIP